MRLAELLKECERTFLTQWEASMKREGIPPDELAVVIARANELIEAYNAHVLLTVGGTLLVQKVVRNGNDPQA